MSDVERIFEDEAEGGDWTLLRTAILAAADQVRADAPLLNELGLRLDLGNVVEFGPAALSRVSAAHRKESSERKRLEAVARANFAAQAQTHAAAIDLLEARDLADLAARADALARERFGVTAGVLALEGPEKVPRGWRPLVEGQTDLILGPRRAARMGRLPTAVGLFGEAAGTIGSVAMVRLSLWKPVREGVLAIGAADPDAFAAEMGSELIAFLGRVAERTAERWAP
jgi:uncharacterized protein YigA (DUF484 family)